MQHDKTKLLDVPFYSVQVLSKEEGKEYYRKCYQETRVLKPENLVRPWGTALCGMLLSQTSRPWMQKDDDDDDDYREVPVTSTLVYAYYMQELFGWN